MTRTNTVWIILTAVLVGVIIYLLLHQPDVIPAEVKAKDVLIAQGRREADSLKKRLAMYEKANNTDVAIGSAIKDSAVNDSLRKALTKAKGNEYALARKVKERDLTIDALQTDTWQDADCLELANKVLLDSAAFIAISENDDRQINTFKAVIGVKDSTITQLKSIVVIQDGVIKNQDDKAALQSAEIKKIKKKSTIKSILIGAAAGLAAVGWILAAK